VDSSALLQEVNVVAIKRMLIAKIRLFLADLTTFAPFPDLDSKRIIARSSLHVHNEVMIFRRKSTKPDSSASGEISEVTSSISLPIEEIEVPALEKIDSSIESKILEKEIETIEATENKNDQSEIVPEYKVGKVLRQGPWMHPFPLIVGMSIIGLLAALFASNMQINRLSEELDRTDYFHAPPNLSQLITNVQKSTMVVTCGNSQGSGWVISLGEVIDTADAETKQIDKMYPGSVITNYHVIADCVGDRRAVTTSNGSRQYEAILFSTDEENDLAIVSTKLVLPALEISKSPSPGWWSMALGSPFGLEKSISIGNIMNVLEKQIVSTAPINPGNSGGPLVNSFGQVMGTNTWKLRDADGFNVAKSVSLLCVELVVCDDPIWNS
jgi:hypothetical protein